MRNPDEGRRPARRWMGLIAALAMVCSSGAQAGSAPTIPPQDVPGARSTEILHMLQTYCVAGRANAAAAMEASRADGFALAPTAMVQPMVEAAGIRNADVRAKFIDRAMIIVAAGNMVESGQNFDFCAIGVVPAPTGPLVEDVRAWLGVDPASAGEEGMTTFSYVENPNGQRRSAEELTVAQMRQAALEGRVHVVAVLRSPEITMLMYGALHGRTS